MTTLSHLHEVSKVVKLLETESRIVVVRGWREGRKGSCSVDKVVHLLSCVQLFATQWTVACQASLSFTVSGSLLKCPLSQWCHPTVSSNATFFFCPLSFPASWSFPMSQCFTSSGLSFGASASVLPMNIQGWFPLELIGLNSLLSKGLSRVFSSTVIQTHQFFGLQPSFWSNFHICAWLLGKP